MIVITHDGHPHQFINDPSILFVASRFCSVAVACTLCTVLLAPLAANPSMHYASEYIYMHPTVDEGMASSWLEIQIALVKASLQVIVWTLHGARRTGTEKRKTKYIPAMQTKVADTSYMPYRAAKG
jgi:hypothetical protein